MRAEERRKLTWEDATERFLDVAELKPGERPKGWEEACDKLTWNAFNSISGAQVPLASDPTAEAHQTCLLLHCQASRHWTSLKAPGA